MNINISEFLKDFTSDLPESVRAGEVYRLTYSSDLKHISFYVHYEDILPAEDIFAFEKAMETALQVERIRLNCRYPEGKFSLSALGELFPLLKRDIAVMNGFLDNAECRKTEDKLFIKIKYGGLEILEKSGFPRKLSAMIYNQFGVKLGVELEGEVSVSSAAYDEMIEELEASMPDYSDQLIPEKSPEEIRREEAQSVIPTKSVDITSLNKDFDPESAEIIKGRAIRNQPVSISEAMDMLGTKITVVGDVFASETKELRNEKTVVTFDITDYSGSLIIKLFMKNSEEELLKKLGGIKKGQTLLVTGKIDYDQFARDIVISADSLIRVKRIPRMDNYPEKRVELHCHTNMSAMDAVTDPVTLINRAASWGHQAMAITDHGCVQAFPDCMYNMPKDFKVIYGMEAYVVNDIDRQKVLKKPDGRSLNDEIIIFDVETTGLNLTADRLTEIGAVKLKNLQVVDSFNTKVNPNMHIPEKITELTGISDADVADAPQEDEAIRKFMEFCGESPVLAAHNANFDTTFINEACRRSGIEFDYNWIDTLILCTATALMCLCSGTPRGEDVSGAPYVQNAISTVFGHIGPIFITVAMLLFAFTTLLGNLYYVDNALAYLNGKKTPSDAFMRIFRIICAVVVFLGAIISMDAAWALADITMGLMCLINLPCCAALSGVAVKALKDYEKQKKEGKNPQFRAANIGLDEADVEFWK